MAEYLTPTAAADYLPPAIIDRADFDFLRAKAEREVISHYTRKRKDMLYRISGLLDTVLRRSVQHLLDPQRRVAVMLQWYKDDASEVDESDPEQAKFLDAMRAEIAEHVEHLAQQYEPGGTRDDREVQSQSRGARSVSYFGERTDLRSGFGSYLQPYDLRPKTTYI